MCKTSWRETRKPIMKPVKEEKVETWGVVRKNPKPDKKNWPKHSVNPIHPVWEGDPLLEPPYKGHKLDKVTQELNEEIMERSKGVCEWPGCDCKHGLERNHIAGHSRKAHIENMVLLCVKHHKVPDGFHAYDLDGVYGYYMKKYQLWCRSKGYNRKEISFLLGLKSGSLCKK